MILQRDPSPWLRPFVARLWAAEGPPDTPYPGQFMREHVLPTALTHVVLRLGDTPLWIRDPSATAGARVASCLIGGARSRFHVREFSASSCSVGAVLWPGAAPLLFGCGAHEIAQRHTALDDIWGADAHRLRARLCEIPSAEGRLAHLESTLTERLLDRPARFAAVTHLVRCVHTTSSIREAVARSGISHRHFIALFRHAVGLTPKTYLRVRRFQHGLCVLRSHPALPLADVAAIAGYSDQSHFGREFLQASGVTATQYRARRPPERNHLPVPDRT